MAKILHVRESDWQAVETSPKPVLVDFWAEWCGPCRMLAPTFERLAEKYQTGLSFAKVNVDEVGNLADRYAVRSIPTLLLLERGNVVERVVGLRSYEELARVIDQRLAAAAKQS